MKDVNQFNNDMVKTPRARAQQPKKKNMLEVLVYTYYGRKGLIKYTWYMCTEKLEYT